MSLVKNCFMLLPNRFMLLPNFLDIELGLSQETVDERRQLIASEKSDSSEDIGDTHEDNTQQQLSEEQATQMGQKLIFCKLPSLQNSNFSCAESIGYYEL